MNLETYNLSLLAKWWWHFLVDKNAVCCGCLDGVESQVHYAQRLASIWWRDLWSIFFFLRTTNQWSNIESSSINYLWSDPYINPLASLKQWFNSSGIGTNGVESKGGSYFIKRLRCRLVELYHCCWEVYTLGEIFFTGMKLYTNYEIQLIIIQSR